MRAPREPVVHLELHTGDRAGARDFYTRLFRWRAETIECRRAGSYLALGLGGDVDGGIVECPTRRPVWLPYVEVADVAATTEAARELGAAVLLEPRAGPAGRRSVVASPAGGEIALWEPRW
jgi:predicted enzyme related to lactoylglutathione lyase